MTGAEPENASSAEPAVYAVSLAGERASFTRRRFVELAAVGSAAIALGGCGGDSPATTRSPTTTEPPPTSTPTTSTTTTSTTTTSTTTTTTTSTTQPPTTTIPPEPGTVPPGEEGIELDIDGTSYTLPCGSPIPDGAVCTCNCVEVPSCSCVGHTACTCVGHTACTCDTVGSHYWYPN